MTEPIYYDEGLIFLTYKHINWLELEKTSLWNQVGPRAPELDLLYRYQTETKWEEVKISSGWAGEAASTYDRENK